MVSQHSPHTYQLYFILALVHDESNEFHKNLINAKKLGVFNLLCLSMTEEYPKDNSKNRCSAQFPNAVYMRLNS